MSSSRQIQSERMATSVRAPRTRALVVWRHHILVRISHWLTIPLLLGLILIVDLRHTLEDEAEPRTLPGALRLPAEKLEERGGELPQGKTLVLYCS